MAHGNGTLPTARRVALVTGGSRGLGLAVARLLARGAWALALTAREPEPLQQAAALLRQQADDVLALPGDVADPAHVERLVAETLGRYGHVDALLNNASTIGLSPMPTLEAYPLEVLEHVLRVNVVAPLHLAQRVLPGMKARRQGVIVNVTSDAGVQAYPGWGGYGASKAALEHLSRTLAAELEGCGVRVYVVEPGDMDTRMHREAEPGVDLSHLASPAAVAPAIAALIEQETAPFGRFEAQRMVAADAPWSR